MGSALLSDSGVDTIRLRWREDYEAFERFSHRKEGYIEGYRGERFVQTDLGRIGSFPSGLFYIEGRAAALATWDRDNHSLLPVEQLHSAEQAALYWMHDNEAPVGALGEAKARLGRIDLASELRFAQPAEGSAFLHSLASLDVPWCKSRIDGRKGGQIETVSFHGTRGRTIYLRAYDKGVESASDRPGVRIRVERQKRYRKDREPSVDDLNVVDLRRAYWGREFQKLSNLPSALVADLRGALLALAERARTYQEMERLAGFLVLGEYIEYDDSTLHRRYSALRELGIFVDPTQVERLEVPVGQYLQTLGAAWAA